jgi:hypothetical protein
MESEERQTMQKHGNYLNKNGQAERNQNCSDQKAACTKKRNFTKITALARSNARYARAVWGAVPTSLMKMLSLISAEHRLSVASGDLQLLDGRWYITHSGLLRIAHRQNCLGIDTCLQEELSDPAQSSWVFKATVHSSAKSKGFVGYGDANLANTSPLVRGAEMRVAETRAVNRALRKAYGIGLCSVEELGALSGSSSAARYYDSTLKAQPQNGSNNGQPRLKDKLCLLVRQFNLDANLVKAYAADFCGTETLRGATRELVESFISQLETQANENRDSLICKLNSYSHPQEVRS